MKNSKFKPFKPRNVGVDLFSNPIKAIASDRGLFLNENLEDIFPKLPHAKPYLSALKALIEDKYYWGEFEIIQMLLKYINEAVGSKLIKPNLIVSIPEEIYSGILGSLFARMVIEAGMSSGWRQVRLLDNYSCAAIGTEELIGSIDEVEQYGKKLFIYSNDYCTYIGVVFGRQKIDLRIFESSISAISKAEIESAVNSLQQSMPSEFPQGFSNNIYHNDPNMLNQVWSKPLENSIYVSTVDGIKGKLGDYIGNHRLLYSPNHKICIVDGLLKIANNSYLVGL